MPLIVNGELVPEELIQEELRRLKTNPQWDTIVDPIDRGVRLQRAAEEIAVNRLLLKQAAWDDEITVDEAAVRKEVEQQALASGCRSAFDRSRLLAEVEEKYRTDALLKLLVPDYNDPTESDARSFYEAHRQHFLGAEMIEAAHIVKHVDTHCSDDEARSVMENALSELNGGRSFAEVVESHSDCKENGGHIGKFSRGVMVEEFEKAISGLKEGERSGVFRTPLGYHIAEVRARIAPAPAEYEEVKDHVLRTLRFGFRQRAFELAVAALREVAQISYCTPAQAERLARVRLEG